jgi:hypothetical protein
LACGPWYYEPQDYTLYRASDRYLSIDYPIPVFSIDANDNCLLWQSDTKTSASLQEIYDVVYKTSLKDIQELNSNKGNKCRLYKENTFARTLFDDKEALSVLLLAKRCEVTRDEMADPWYYPAKVDPHRTALAEIAGQGVNGLNNQRFWKRYAVQATRAMLTLGQYKECLDLWNQIKDRDWNDCLKVLTVRNVAGAYYHLGDIETARRMYGAIDDAPSLLMCSNESPKEFILNLYELSPNSQYLRDLVEKHIHYEYFVDIDLTGYLTQTVGPDLYDICIKFATEGKVKDPDFWYYGAAFIKYQEKKYDKALNLISQAEKSAGSEYIKESVHVLRICIEAESKPYSRSYESAMLEHVKWLDNKILEHHAEAVEPTRHEGIRKLSINESYFYWNDMLRRLIHGTLCPKLIKNHREVLAMALANMADNRLLNLQDSIAVITYDKDYNWVESTYTMKEYRENRDIHNDHDYSNSFFCMIDSLPIDKVIQYVQTLELQTDLQRYLNERSYIDKDYLFELIGTRYLREAKYSEAVKWLSKVSPEYQYRMNTYEYIEFQPYSFEKVYILDKTNYKYNFAKEMARLENVINTSSNSDSVALSKAKLAIGMKNSAYHCWPLIYYHLYEYDFDDDYPTPYSRAKNNLLGKAERTYTSALSSTANTETKARIQLMFGNYKFVMSNYSNTEAAQSITGRCDNYYDYHLNSRSNYKAWWIDY